MNLSQNDLNNYIFSDIYYFRIFPNTKWSTYIISNIVTFYHDNLISICFSDYWPHQVEITRKESIRNPKSGIPRWRLEGGSRKRASYSEILDRC
jgi:hypothetical protein